jgi:limonene 1,2-monooxygenase
VVKEGYSTRISCCRLSRRLRVHDLARIQAILALSGGFGTVIGFVHDWANPENTRRSWDMVARYVVPEINGYLAGLRQSRDFVATHREVFNRARAAVMAKITEHEAAATALAVTQSPLLAAASSNVPDLDQTPARRASQ